MRFARPGIIAALVFLFLAPLHAATTDPWQAVHTAIREDLPRTAIEHLERIGADALANGRHAEAVHAIALQIALEGRIHGSRAEEKIRRLETEIGKAPPEMRPLMEAILAHWYWEFFRQNRWRFRERSASAGDPGPDILTWELPTILSEIDRHFNAALADEAPLKATPIQDWDALLQRGTAGDNYRPTLFDFLAWEALSFYKAGEQAAMLPQGRFVVAADSPIFDAPDAFLAWDPGPDEGYAPERKAVRLYQKLLAFHRDDPDRSAFLDADLDRLLYGYNVAVGREKRARCEAALRRFIDAAGDHETAGRAIARLAELRMDAEDFLEAHALATRGAEAFGDSVGGRECRILLRRIEGKEIILSTESVWSEPRPTIDITYRNLTHVWFRAYRLDLDECLERDRRDFSPSSDELRDLLKDGDDALALAWDHDLSPTEDYKLRRIHLPDPSLAPGYYLIVASASPDFLSETKNAVSSIPIFAGNLALVLETRTRAGPTVAGFVLDARDGEPIEGAQVQFWTLDRNRKWRLARETVSDAAGRFQATFPEEPPLLVAARKADQIIAVDNLVLHEDPYALGPRNETTAFFTDRTLYRPGQTIHYKGICIAADTEAADYHTLPDRSVTVILRDLNGKEIARAEHRTNDYGSFSGTFTAPRDRLTGYLKLAVAEGPSGATTIRMEEYRRPKFRVKLTRSSAPVRISSTVRVHGRAVAYTGAPVDGAKVEWRITRYISCPTCGRHTAFTPLVVHGATTTASDGSFTIEFTAAPDEIAAPDDDPEFFYIVHADVTDSAGETHTDVTEVRAGYTTLKAVIDTDAWLSTGTPVRLRIRTTSRDGDPAPARGQLTIYALKQPDSVHRPQPDVPPFHPPLPSPPSGSEEPPDLSNPKNWAAGEPVFATALPVGEDGVAEIEVPLPAGIYRASAEFADPFGKPVAAHRTIEVLDPHARRFPIRVPQRLILSQESAEPGETFRALWGTGYDRGRAFVELSCAGKVLQAYWTDPGQTQVLIEQPVTEAMRGGFTLRTFFVHENRAYLEQRTVSVPWSNKRLEVKWESFRSKLLPGATETWTAVVTGPDAEPAAAAEMVATLYDASLDLLARHAWPDAFAVFRRESRLGELRFSNDARHFKTHLSTLNSGPGEPAVDWSYRHFPPLVVPFTEAFIHNGRYFTERGLASATVFELDEPSAPTALADTAVGPMATSFPNPPQPPALDLVRARANLQETAFFLPHLVADGDGRIRFQFTMPEALTSWRFFGFAHDHALRAGLLTDTVVTSKDLMVQPNPPRFVREGDVIEFTVKVTNRTDAPQAGRIRLTFADAATLESADAAIGNATPERAFSLPPRASRSYAWRLAIPDSTGFLIYRAVAATEHHSDGEEGFLPVLSRKTLVTESLPLTVRGTGPKTFTFARLLAADASDTLQHRSLTIEMTSNPAWYAVLALPYLMEFPHACSEQIFNRLYANALARHIADSDPRIRRVFELWRNTPALDSPLEKNTELKAVMLEETPWLREAADESQARRHLALLFDENHIDDQLARAFTQLAEQQRDDGFWPWFPGGPGNEYITLYIVTGFGRLRHLGVDIDLSPARKALPGLDRWMTDKFLEQPQPAPTPIEVLYLYARSFFLEDAPPDADLRALLDRNLERLRHGWPQLDSRQSRAHAALALQRFGDAETARNILRSLREYALVDDELGMYWNDTDEPWRWHRAPIETQAMMIEAFDEIAHDHDAVEACKLWLLNQKRTQNWKTTKATADAVYALLLRGTDLLANNPRLDVTIGGRPLEPTAVEAGTGFFEKRFGPGQIAPEMGRITIDKAGEGVSWGAVHWQYLEDIDRITPHAGTPLSLEKSVFVRKHTDRGTELQPLNGPVAVGDELVVRLVLRADRDMEYLHLKDQRGSGTEPVNVLSGYRYQDGLAYYESTRDTASHFFIDYLPRGTYVFEYSTRVQLRGRYQSGIAEIQCMYAPEFNRHSESITIEAR